MGMTRTGAGTTRRWTAQAGPGAPRRRLPAGLPAGLPVGLLLTLLLLGACAQGPGAAAPGGQGPDGTAPVAPDPTAEPTEGPTDSPTSDPTSEVPGAPVPTGEVPPLPVPSGLPGGAALPVDPAGADLTLVVGPPGAQQPPVTLVCDWRAGTASGTHPQAAQACADLRAAVTAGNPFTPVAPDAMCTQQYGGDAVVEVTGAVLGADGGPVDVAGVFTLTDGCQIGRFTAMGAVLAPFRGTV